ncbi:MAG: hypothetical protein MJY61_04090 [Bacteroidales bacterium]|nr:hypothetical protein [Bacteroidales bacterium]
MKKIFLTIATAALAASISFGQDLAEAFQVAQEANEAWTSKNYTQALAGFQKAISIVEACEEQGGEQGKELIGQCKNAIPSIAKSIGIEKVNAGDFTAAIEAFNNAKALADKYGADDVAAEIEGIIETVNESAQKAKGKQLFEDAEALYQEGKLDEALDAFKIARENGFEEAAKRIITICVKKANNLYTEGKFTDAVDAAKEVFLNPDASEQIKTAATGIIAGCCQKQVAANKLTDAGKYFNVLSELDSDNAKLGQLAYAIGATYFKGKNTAQAKTWLTKALKDPKVAANAKQILGLIK